MLDLVRNRIVGRRWDPERRGAARQWFTYGKCWEYIDRAICPEHETGVPGAVRAAVGDRVLARAISVGAGYGNKELRLVETGQVGHFTLYDLSEGSAAQARRNFAEAGLADRMDYVVGDAFEIDTPAAFDLVYWDHALHHMSDVAAALRWSLRVLKPGGLLVVNDYVGPTRVQWRRPEIDYARRFLAEVGPGIGVDPRSLRYKTPLDRLRQFIRDPSEAPQSDRIVEAYRAATGTPLHPLGGVMLQLCTRFLPTDDDHPAFDAMLDWDRAARDDGFSYFAFGLWQKPASPQQGQE